MTSSRPALTKHCRPRRQRLTVERRLALIDAKLDHVHEHIGNIRTVEVLDAE